MPGDRPLLRRRAVVRGVAGGVLGAGAGVLLAGCDNGDEIAPPGPSADPSESATGGPTTTAPTAEAEQTPDEELVDEVLAALSTAAATLVLARKDPRLRPAAAALLRAHRAHAGALEAELDPSGPDAPPGSPATLASVRLAERTLRATLVDAAGRAESGALARLLASMSASVTQHLTLLPGKAGA